MKRRNSDGDDDRGKGGRGGKSKVKGRGTTKKKGARNISVTPQIPDNAPVPMPHPVPEDPKKPAKAFTHPPPEGANRLCIGPKD